MPKVTAQRYQGPGHYCQGWGTTVAEQRPSIHVYDLCAHRSVCRPDAHILSSAVPDPQCSSQLNIRSSPAAAATAAGQEGAQPKKDLPLQARAFQSHACAPVLRGAPPQCYQLHAGERVLRLLGLGSASTKAVLHPFCQTPSSMAKLDDILPDTSKPVMNMRG
eukprot:1138014-Pelagomonas_calceolata.AAC.5